MNPFRIPLRIVFYREVDTWIAHCLEFDLIGDGDTKGDAMEALATAICMQFETSMRHKNPANLFNPADGQYFQMFATGRDVAQALLEVGIEHLRRDSSHIDDILAREWTPASDDALDEAGCITA